jgi:hypothetical protein
MGLLIVIKYIAIKVFEDKRFSLIVLWFFFLIAYGVKTARHRIFKNNATKRTLRNRGNGAVAK